MNSVLDLVISSIIGGMVLVTILTLNSNMIETSTTQNLNTVTQSELATVVQVLEYDLRKTGYRIASTDSAISLMDTSSITIHTDYDNNGITDSLNYRMSTSAIPQSPNTRCRYLLRRMNAGNFDTIATTITRFRLYYYGANGAITTYRSLVKSFRIIINTESQNTLDSTLYSGVSWDRVFKPKNL